MAPGDIFDEIFGTPKRSRGKKKNDNGDMFSMGDIGLSDVGSFDLFGSGNPRPQKTFRIRGKSFVEDPNNPGKLIRVSKKRKQQQNDNDFMSDIFNLGGNSNNNSRSNDMGIFGIGDVGDTKKNPSIIGNKKQIKETQESIDIITSDAKRAGGAIKGGISSLRQSIKNRQSKVKLDSQKVIERTPIPQEPEIQIDDSGSTASRDSDKEFCFQATKDGRTISRCFRNPQIALRTRESFVSRGYSVTAIDAKTRI